MPYDKNKYERFQGDPLVLRSVMQRIREESERTGVSMNRIVARRLEAAYGDPSPSPSPKRARAKRA